MAVHSGSVPLTTSEPTLVYETPDGVETTLVVQVAETEDNNNTFGDSTVVAGEGIVLANNSQPLVLTRFTGSLFGIGPGTAVFIAADIQ